jgi:hypothetical protein
MRIASARVIRACGASGSTARADRLAEAARSKANATQTIALMHVPRGQLDRESAELAPLPPCIASVRSEGKISPSRFPPVRGIRGKPMRMVN